MKFSGSLRRSSLRVALVALTACAVALLASCGGGSQSKKFAPGRVLSFGDESSVIDDSKQPGNGRKYTVNNVNADTGVLDCVASPLWTQYVAQVYGFYFAQCNPGGIASPQSKILAVPGAKTTDLPGQIDQFLQTDSFRADDLVTVMMGVNDILELYRQYPNASEAALTAAAEQRGTDLAQQVNRIANAGAKVLISTIYDVGLSPYAGIERTNHVDIDRAGLMSRLTDRFNTKLRVAILNDGHKIGLILTNELILSIAQFPAQSNYANISDPACDLIKAPSVLDCTTSTLVDGGSGDVWLWADLTHLSPGGQLIIGQTASVRALNNPF
jgi:phospholipase/lecithinase/hemolysin